MAFLGNWLHPEEPCSGLTDYIDIEATIQDEFLHKKFIGLYGTPSINDYENVTKLMAHKELLIAKIYQDKIKIKAYEKVLHIPIIRLALKIYEFFSRK